MANTLIFAISCSVFSGFSYADSTTSMGIRLTIIPATTLPSSAETPLATVENALASNELFGLELDASLSDSMIDESPTDLLRRLEKNLDSAGPSASAPIVLTLTAG